MAQPSNNLVVVGTDTLPIVLGISGGASDVWTYTHNQGRRAKMLEFIARPDGFAVPNASVTKAQPSVNAIVLTNTTGGTFSGVLRITWDDLSMDRGQELPATAGVLS